MELQLHLIAYVLWREWATEGMVYEGNGLQREWAIESMIYEGNALRRNVLVVLGYKTRSYDEVYLINKSLGSLQYKSVFTSLILNVIHRSILIAMIA
jgi:hypothetical protein